MHIKRTANFQSSAGVQKIQKNQLMAEIRAWDQEVTQPNRTKHSM